MVLQIALVIVAYYAGKQGLTMDDIYYLAKRLIERVNEED